MKYNIKNASIIKDQISKVVFKSDTGFEMKLNELFSEIIETYYTGKSNVDYNTTMYTVNVMEDEEEIPDQFQIYNSNYNMISELLEKQCYKLEPKIIDLLATAYNPINVNKKDSNGSTPIFYAIKNLHQKSIKKLLEHNANVYIYSVANNNGITPYRYALDNYKHHIGSLIENNTYVTQIIKKFTEPIYTQIKENIEVNQDFKNNIVRYMDIIFPQLIVMFNNLLYYYSKSYINDWSYENQKELEKLLVENKLIENIDNKLPILENINQTIINYSVNLDSLNKKTQIQDTDTKINTIKINKLKSIKSNLQKELDDLNKKNSKDDYTNALIKGTQEKIKILNTELKNISNADKLTKKENTQLTTNIMEESNKIYNDLKERAKKFMLSNKYLGLTSNTYEHIFRHVSLLHNDIFDYVITKTDITSNTQNTGYEDYLLYNKLWKDNLNADTKMRSIFNIHLISSLLQKGLIEKMYNINKKQDIDELAPQMQLLGNLYNKIFAPTITNMSELPQNYNSSENYILTETLDIIKHIIKSVLCSNLYYAIVKIMVKYISSLNPKELMDKTKLATFKKLKYNDYIREIVNKIINPNYGVSGATQDAKLHKYILNEMPTFLVKILIKIYKDDLDEEKSIKTIDELFQNIINIIISNDIFVIKKDSTLVSNLENYVFKYYKEVFMQIIPKMKIVVDNYCRFILNETRFINMMNKLNEAVKLELVN